MKKKLSSCKYDIIISKIEPITISIDKNEWIKCSDRLPEDQSYNIVYSDDVYIAKFIEKKDKRLKKRSGTFEVSDDYFENDITHWMPLPTPPT
jgi:hypothetical protein